MLSAFVVVRHPLLPDLEEPADDFIAVAASPKDRDACRDLFGHPSMVEEINMLRDPKALGHKLPDIGASQSRGRRPKVLAVSSGGGHWVQMMRIKHAFENCDVTFVTVHESYREQVPDRKFYLVNDANRWTRFGLFKAACRLAWIVWNERPDVVISTGAAPGYLALRFGRLFNARTIWLDSIANAETLSMSGDRIGRYADLWLTQWPHLARPNGPYYTGSVL